MIKSVFSRAALCALGLSTSANAAVPIDFDAAYQSISEEDLARHIKTLASDAYEGRAPGTKGEKLTVAYLSREFRGIGLNPGAKDGFEQQISFAEVKRDPKFAMSLTKNGSTTEFTPFDEFVAFAGDATGKGEIVGARLVFAGYGIDAPEYGWDDYRGLNVDGAVVVLMRGEPGKDDDETYFMGRELTDHYHLETKYQLAASKGALGAITIHTEESAGWPWSLMQSGGSGAVQFFPGGGKSETQLRSSAQISEPAAKRLFAETGHDYEALTSAARRAPGAGVDLAAIADIRFNGATRKLKSSNVIAKITGREAPEECVIYTAHWDHVGVNRELEGDQIFNGALDNATGTAGLLEIAQAYAMLPQPPRRSIYFVATTAEEKGLFGAKFLAENPPCAPEKIAAVLNMDSHFPFGSHKAMTVPGFGYSEIQLEFERAAARLGRVLQPDSNPEVGAFFRNDAYPFAQRGIPSIYAVGGPLMSELTDGSAILGRYVDYVSNKYHKPGDEFDPATWDMTGLVEDFRIFFEAGLSIAESERYPNWRYDLPYRKARDAMMAR